MEVENCDLAEQLIFDDLSKVESLEDKESNLKDEVILEHENASIKYNKSGVAT